MSEIPAVHLRECAGCGQFQLVAKLTPGTTARCIRCTTRLHRAASHSLDHTLALGIAAFVLLIITCVTTLMTVRLSGILHHAGLFSGPEELVRRDMTALAVVVVFVTVVAPIIRLVGIIYVLIRLHETRPPHHLRRVFATVECLTPWSMMEVFVFGVFVAYVKLNDVVTIEMNAGVYALLGLTFILVWMDGALDREAVWDELDHSNARAKVTSGRLPRGAVGCETCGLVVAADPVGTKCPRCSSALHPRKPDSMAWTAALVLAAAVLYVPANLYPVLTVVQLGAGSPSTILGGVRELIISRMYPLAALVFFASIAVPMMKLIGLTFMLVTTWLGHGVWLRERTRLYYIVRWVGRWSMIDIFMEALLGALVQFGNVITIEPGIGAVAFCAVVILTMFAAETFDPRVMWDSAAAEHHRQSGASDRFAR
jgi:paraquat-inducible protein A